jgi:arginase family enzyme
VAAWQGRNVYVTIDLDCLAAAFVEVDWETGLFTPDDLVWALRELGSRCNLVGGDLCGARSERRYARWTQRFASEFDHPEQAGDFRPTGKNRAVLDEVRPVLTGP